MISGYVNKNREVRVRLTIQAPGGTPHELEALVDTGFNGSLTIPAVIAEELALPWRTRGSFRLADGTKARFDIHAAEILWDGTWRRILVEVTGRAPLLGMSLLDGFELRILVVDDGLVQIARPSSDPASEAVAI